MSIYIPFTYIIGWSQHKKFYYGAKYAQGCQPSDLWESYFTSSNIVKQFREEHGEPDIIKIHRTFSDGDSCVLFETEYLTKINAKDNNLFLNESNGVKGFNGSGASWTKHSFKKAKRTWNEKYGVDNPSQSDEIKQKKRDTCMKNWGYEYASQAPEIVEKRKQTNLERYNVEYPSQLPESTEKRKQTNLEQYGYEHATQSPEVKEKTKLTCIERWGYESHNQSPIIQDKKRKTCLEKYGVDSTSKIMRTCIYCGQYKCIPHQHLCKLNPNRNLGDRSSRTNSYEVVSPEGETFYITGMKNLEIFAKERGLPHWNFSKKLTCPGWIIEKL